MRAIAHIEVQKLAEGESPQVKFLRLSADERRQFLSQQAEQIKDYYEQTTAERAEWQVGNFIEAHQNGI